MEKLVIAIAAGNELEELTGMRIVSEQPASHSTEFVLSSPEMTLGQAKIAAAKVLRKYGQRCVGAFPSGDKFVVVLKTNLRVVSKSSGKPKTLKINDEDFADLSKALLSVTKQHPEAYEKYKAQGLSDMRYNWDVFRTSKFPIDRLYKYLNDNHINAALAAILKNSGKGKPK